MAGWWWGGAGGGGGVSVDYEGGRCIGQTYPHDGTGVRHDAQVTRAHAHTRTRAHAAEAATASPDTPLETRDAFAPRCDAAATRRLLVRSARGAAPNGSGAPHKSSGVGRTIQCGRGARGGGRAVGAGVGWAGRRGRGRRRRRGRLFFTRTSRTSRKRGRENGTTRRTRLNAARRRADRSGGVGNDQVDGATAADGGQRAGHGGHGRSATAVVGAASVRAVAARTGAVYRRHRRRLQRTPAMVLGGWTRRPPLTAPFLVPETPPPHTHVLGGRGRSQCLADQRAGAGRAARRQWHEHERSQHSRDARVCAAYGLLGTPSVPRGHPVRLPRLRLWPASARVPLTRGRDGRSVRVGSRAAHGR